LVPPPKTESLASRLSVPEPPKVETASQPLPGGRTLPAAAIPAPPTVPPPPAPAKQETPRPPAAQTPAAQPAAAAPKPIERLRIGGQVQEARVISRVQPAYPQLARQARITGVVRVAATVGTDGRVKRARAVSGPPLLRQAAVDAVQRWKYAPGTLNGDPVEVTTEVDVTFTLGGR
jgi:protein TonB